MELNIIIEHENREKKKTHPRCNSDSEGILKKKKIEIYYTVSYNALCRVFLKVIKNAKRAL